MFEGISGESSDFGEGKSNTTTLIEALADYPTGWNYGGLWGMEDLIEKAEDGWFVPSKSEWSAFAYLLEITSGNYDGYGIDSFYWSSSVKQSGSEFMVYFVSGEVLTTAVYSADHYIRLSTTF